MAKKNSTVFLGYIDEPISEDGPNCGDFTVNKIGGTPVWTSEISHLTPLCKICKLKSVLVVQLYAPLENSPYHRCLFLFACINPDCWNKKESWACIRHQCIDPTYTVANVSEHTKALTVENLSSAWSNDAEDWGSETDDENGNIENGIINLTVSPSSYSLQEKPNVAGSAGATGFATPPVATAEIERGEEDVVQIDSPVNTQVNVMSLLCSSIPVPQVSPERFQFVPHHLDFAAEPSDSSSSSPDDGHVARLLEAYARSTHPGAGPGAELGPGPPPAGGEAYERAAPAHGDKSFHRFSARLRRNAGQVIRYCRDDAHALWMSRAEVTRHLRCAHCASPLTFEWQLLPTVIPSLALRLAPRAAGERGHLEFGCVFVFTCAASCWAEEDAGPREETVIVQTEDY